MPLWLQIIVWTSAGVAAVGIIWRKFVKPGANVVSKFEQATPLFEDLHVLVPLLTDFMTQFRNTPGVFTVLNDMARQFRTDSGSSLRDVINRIEVAATEATTAAQAAAREAANATRENRVAAQVIAANLEAERRLGEQGRQQVAELMQLVRIFGAKQNIQGLQLDAQDAATADVADDLRKSHERAEAHDEDAPPGTASDAAMRREDEP